MSQAQGPVGSTVSDKFSPTSRMGALFLISVLGLFLELMLIRWIGTEIRIFAYLQNTVLVVCFMGLGMGCLTCRRPIAIRQMLVPLLVLVLLLALPPTRTGLGYISQLLSVLGDMVIWEQSVSTSSGQALLCVTLGLLGTFLLMVLLFDMFVPIGQILGRLLDDHPNTIWAYSVNVAGSLIGIWLFVLLSVFHQPPWTWCLVLAVLTVFFLGAPGRERQVNLFCLLAIVALSWLAGWEADSIEIRWSPYQKLALKRIDSQTAAEPGWWTFATRGLVKRLPTVGGEQDFVIAVNNTGYQAMLNLDLRDTQQHPQRFASEQQGLSQYDIPLLLHPKPDRFLVVGAGSGNDAAGGLRQGAKSVTAVEIDPAIIAMGQRLHPEQPYSSPAVHVVQDDARSFFATTDQRFDVITFGLLDSHTTTAMTNARLDHYVYTRESIARAKDLLADGGLMVLSFEATKPFIADRMAGVLRSVFGHEPLCFRVPHNNYGWGGVMFVAGNLPAAQRQLERNPRLASLIAQWQRDEPVALSGTSRLITDDWPYVYLERASIPLLYFLLAGLLVLLFLRAIVRLQLGRTLRGWNVFHWHFFFLGAAFMLLEVQNISKASVVLGNTWQVNAVIISGILAMILLSNLLVARFPALPMGPVYVLLCGTCLLLYFIDLSRFAFLPYVTKAVVVGGLTSLPMLFSGIVFIRSFANVSGKDAALGANLFGALVGALLQTVTFLTGIKALLLIVAGLYLLALTTRPRPVIVSCSVGRGEPGMIPVEVPGAADGTAGPPVS